MQSKFEWPNLIKNLLLDISYTAKKIDIKNIAVVGGAVRDQLLKKLNNSEFNAVNHTKDIDLVIEGSVIELVKMLEKELGLRRFYNLKLHKSYNSAEIKIDGFKLDLSTARLEEYEKPGENPNIYPCIIEEDLKRRDFTINSIGIDISSSKMIDPHGGQDSLKRRELKFLHSKSVEDDPTRIIRAARYSARLAFNLHPKSLRQIQSTLSNWPWGWKEGDDNNLAPPALSTRLRLELELLIYQERWDIALKNLQSWGALVLLDHGLQNDLGWERRLRWAKRLNVNLLTALIAGANNSLSLASRLQLPKRQQDLLKESFEIEEFLNRSNLYKESILWTPSKWSKSIENNHWNPQAVALTICKGGPMWRELLRWWGRWRLIQSPITAKELMAKGWEAGPELGKKLKALRDTRLDNLR